jgi:hypothetical protein
MNSNTRKGTARNSAVLLAAWLAVVIASVNPDIEASTAVIPIAYTAE